jgi:hypothetical protein
MQLVLTNGHHGQPPGRLRLDVAFTSKRCDHGLFAIGVNMQRIQFFGGSMTESSVVLDYIEPTVVPTTADWYFFGWLTPLGGQPRTTRQTATLWQNGAPQCFVYGLTVKSQGFELHGVRLVSVAMTLREPNRPS